MPIIRATIHTDEIKQEEEEKQKKIFKNVTTKKIHAAKKK